MDKPLTIVLIDSYWEAKHSKVIQIELQSQVDDLEKEITLLESISLDMDAIVEKKDNIIAITDAIAKLDAKTIVKMRLKAVWVWIKSTGGMIISGIVGVGVGIGVGYIIAK